MCLRNDKICEKIPTSNAKKIYKKFSLYLRYAVFWYEVRDQGEMDDILFILSIDYHYYMKVDALIYDIVKGHYDIIFIKYL